MKILLLSAYHAASHDYWTSGLQQQLDDIEWTVLTLPPRHFAWRLRGNSLSWAYLERERLQRPFDLLLATSMVDLSALRGLVPALAALPAIVYFHENQFAYPVSERQFSSVEPRILNLYTALAADRVVFNSRFNRDSFLDGCRDLLQRLPDYTPASEVAAQLAECGTVLPVPLKPRAFVAGRERKGALQVVWNHRWEYDKGPEALLRAVRVCMDRKMSFTLHVVGQRFRQAPPAFGELRRLLGSGGSVTAGEFGFVEDEARYRQLLRECDVVLSTAAHDFQGLSVLEAVAAGCRPLLPDRLCYPEWFERHWLYPSSPGDPEREAGDVAAALQSLAELKARGELPVSPDIGALSWEVLAPSYRELFRGCLR